LPTLMATFSNPPAPPSPFTFTAVEPRYEIYGWHVAIDRPALAFSRLEDASRSGFTLAGSGTGTVLTAPLFTPRAVYRVAVARDVRRIAADGWGRLLIPVPLGPGNRSQEYTPQARLTVR